MRAMVLIPALLLGACAKAPAEAPGELADLGLFLFQHFDDEDVAELAAGLRNLRPLVAKDDFTADVKDRAVTMPVLKGDTLGTLSPPTPIDSASPVDPDKQVPRALATMSTQSFAKNREVALEPNRVCIESDSTNWAQRTFSEGAECFGDGSCEWLRGVQETHKESILGKVWFDQQLHARLVDIEEDDDTVTQAMIARYWIEEQSPSVGGGNLSWDQLFAIEIGWDVGGGKTLKWISYWSSISSLLGDDAYGVQVVDGLGLAAIHADEFMAGSGDTCDLDRAAAKPAQ